MNALVFPNPMMSSQYVQYGCGWHAPREWRNFDSSPTLRFERMPLLGRLYARNDRRFPANVEYGDIVKGLPVGPESVTGVYCSHILEHLCLEDCRAALRNTYQVLRSGGVFRFVVPDLEFLVREYLDNGSSEAALAFMKETGLGHENRRYSLPRFLASWLGGSQHLWMWDYKSIESELRDAGFVAIRRAYLHDSSNPMFTEIEDRSRWDNCLGVECRKHDAALSG
ncbi:MAG: methyltransferase domain-containing protein [Gammaproteobacteria bacterium]